MQQSADDVNYSEEGHCGDPLEAQMRAGTFLQPQSSFQLGVSDTDLIHWGLGSAEYQVMLRRLYF